MTAADRQLEDELETERMRLAACMAAALGNTERTVAERIARDHPYWSASYKAVCDAVDREMALRAALVRAGGVPQPETTTEEVMPSDSKSDRPIRRQSNTAAHDAGAVTAGEQHPATNTARPGAVETPPESALLTYMTTDDPARRDAAFLRTYAERVRNGTAVTWEIPSTVAGTIDAIAARIEARG